METLKNATTEVKANDAKNLDAILAKYKNETKGFNSSKSSLFRDNKHLLEQDGGKKFRKDARKFLSSFCMLIKTSTGEKRKEVQKDFIAYYKLKYAINDFSLSSIYRGNTEREVIFYTEVLNILKEATK